MIRKTSAKPQKAAILRGVNKKRNIMSKFDNYGNTAQGNHINKKKKTIMNEANHQGVFNRFLKMIAD